MSIQYTCPRCNGVNTDPEIVNDIIRCSGCNEWFKPDQILKEVAPDNSTTKTSMELAAINESEKIRRNASMLAGIAGFLAIVGFIAGILSIVAAKSGDDASGGFIAAISMIGAALWFYLIAQVVHIRALLEKRKD